METSIDKILEKPAFSKEDLIALLETEGEAKKKLFTLSQRVKAENVGKKVYFRGLIEYSNACSKNCFYCGIRSANRRYQRYRMTDQEVMEAVDFAFESRYGSIVIQAGEQSGKLYVNKIASLLRNIHQRTEGKLHVTLSLGEQTEETYRRWFEAGAHRYLLRIEESDPVLYEKLHPANRRHSYQKRLEALYLLRKTGYQVGTGVMIGLPFQTLSHLAEDLLFFRNLDIDMAGMGPYIEHQDTPLFQYRDQLLPLKTRFDLSLKMVALLRIMMKDINIAATTAMQTIDPQGREKALLAGANVIMPNITPVKYREDYLLYENKPCLDEEAAECRTCLEARISMAGDTIAYGEWGDSAHYAKR